MVDDLFDYAERRTRQDIERLAGGTYRGEFVIDDDGIDLDREYRVRVMIERQGSDLVVDFTGTDPRARGAINASYSQALTGVVYGARCFMDPSIPMNEGVFRPLKVTLPEGTLVNPGPTAALNARIVTIFAIIEAMPRALSQQRPELAVASSGLVHLYTIAGRHPDTGRPWVLLDSMYGGIGARTSKDGVDANGAYLFGGRGISAQVEGIESNLPVLYERLALIRDSGGPGRWRGGLGVDKTIQTLVEADISVRADRIRFPPPGNGGGRPGKPGGWIVNRGRPDEQVLRSKHMGVRLQAGDTLSMLTSGAGGFGPPWERPPELVRADVIAGRVSVAAAEADYGVVFLPETTRIDQTATARRRAELARSRGAGS